MKSQLPAVDTQPPIGAADALKDRRRPGRPAAVTPTLITLLRHPAVAPTTVPVLDRLAPRREPCPQADREPDLGPDREHSDLDTAQGIAVAMALSALIWTVCGGFVWGLLR